MLFRSVEDNTVREELIVFITPVIVETTSTNNIHNTYLERLHEISLPIDEQLENIDKGNDFLNQRLRNPAADYTPDAEPVQSAFDAAQPLQ